MAFGGLKKVEERTASWRKQLKQKTREAKKEAAAISEIAAIIRPAELSRDFTQKTPWLILEAVVSVMAGE